MLQSTAGIKIDCELLQEHIVPAVRVNECKILLSGH